MEKNPNFNIPGIPKGNIDTITTQIVKSAERQTQDVISGELDYMQDPPPADLLPQVKAEYSDRYKEQTPINVYYFFMNTTVPPFDKKEVRQAVNYGVDSTALSRLFGGGSTPGCNFLPPGLRATRRSSPARTATPASRRPREGAKLIKEAGVEGESVDVYTNNDENRPEIGQYLADMLNKIGLKAKLKVIDGGRLLPDHGQRQDQGRDRRHELVPGLPASGQLPVPDRRGHQPADQQSELRPGRRSRAEQADRRGRGGAGRRGDRAGGGGGQVGSSRRPTWRPTERRRSPRSCRSGWTSRTARCSIPST